MNNNTKWLVLTIGIGLILSSTVVMMATAGNGPGGPGGNPDKPGKGGGAPTSDAGDLYGDLVAILREPVNGVPILDQYGCEILINASGGDYIYMIWDPDAQSCTIPEDADVVEISFGRLNVVRSPPQVLESAFDEAIKAFNEATFITLDDAGRFLLTRLAIDADGEVYEYVKAIDSSRENLGLYKKLMADGHLEGNLGTDPYAHVGDPAAPPLLRPVLNVTHFESVVDPNIDFSHLLNSSGLPKDLPLTEEDLMTGASLLAAGADKTGHITVDLVFYMNSIFGLNTKNASGFYDSTTVVNFDTLDYSRENVYAKTVYVLVPELNETGYWVFGHWIQDDVWLMNTTTWPDSYIGSNPAVFTWDNYPTETPYGPDILGFAQASDDALRVISYTHDNKMPPPPEDIPSTAGAMYQYRYRYRNGQ
jgi:hypothetical protein